MREGELRVRDAGDLRQDTGRRAQRQVFDSYLSSSVSIKSELGEIKKIRGREVGETWLQLLEPWNAGEPTVVTRARRLKKGGKE